MYKETSRYINKGVDGVFVEFPHTQYVLFEHFGSRANFPSTHKKIVYWPFMVAADSIDQFKMFGEECINFDDCQSGLTCEDVN